LDSIIAIWRKNIAEFVLKLSKTLSFYTHIIHTNLEIFNKEDKEMI